MTCSNHFRDSALYDPANPHYTRAEPTPGSLPRARRVHKLHGLANPVTPGAPETQKCEHNQEPSGPSHASLPSARARVGRRCATILANRARTGSAESENAK